MSNISVRDLERLSLLEELDDILIRLNLLETIGRLGL